jgi:hypothetical protein
VKVGVEVGNLEEGGVERCLSSLELLGALGSVLGTASSVLGLGLEASVVLVESLHGGKDLVSSVLDLGDTLRLCKNGGGRGSVVRAERLLAKADSPMIPPRDSSSAYISIWASLMVGSRTTQAPPR